MNRALAEHHDLGPLRLGQFAGLLVDRLEQRLAGLTGVLLVHQEGQPTRQERVLLLTIAVSPLNMYSSESASAALIQPVPVVVATAITLRFSPPSRTSSAAANRRWRECPWRS